MRVLVETAIVRCGHDGIVATVASQTWLRVAGTPALVQADPVGRSIKICPNYGVNIKPCLTTLVVQKGYSGFVRVGGASLCLDTVEGFTDGTPPGAVKYTVRSAGQTFVEAAS